MADTKPTQTDALFSVKPKKSWTAYFWSVFDLWSAFNPETLIRATGTHGINPARNASF